MNGSRKLDCSFASSTNVFTIGEDYVINVTDINTEASMLFDGVKTTGTARTNRTTYNLHVFDGNTSGSPRTANQRMNGRIYYFNITDTSGNLVAELVPCYRKVDSVAGMWDRVGKRFLTNVGTGEFVVGGNVD